MATTNSHDIEAPSETTPLISAKAGDEEPEPLKDIKTHTVKERIVAAAAAVSFGTSVAAMMVESSPVVYVSGCIGAAVAPYAVIQQQKLTQCEALKQTNERMGEEVTQLKEENLRLQGTVQELETSVMSLQEMQQTLDTVRSIEGQSIDELERQLEESRTILDSMQDNLRGDILQNLISVVLTVDNDDDSTLSTVEIDKLIARIEGIQGVDLKEDLLRKKLVENGRSLNAIMEVAKNLLDETTPDDQNIFHFMNAQQEKASA